MALYHVFNEVENRRTGVPMSGVQVEVLFQGTETAAPIYADEAGTPFVPENYCVTDADGMYSFYIDAGEYRLNFLIGSQIIKTIDNFTPTGQVGPSGPANSTYEETADLEQADISNVSAILAEPGKAGTFTIRAYADFTAEVAADTGKVNYIRSVASPDNVWVRSSILSTASAQTGTAAGNTVEDELAAKATVLGVGRIDTDMGTTPGAILSNNGTAKAWFGELEGAVEARPTSATLGATSGANLLGFSNDEEDVDGTVGTSLKARGVVVTDAPFNADPTGSADSYAAFTAAISASPCIRVPAGTYKLNTQPTWAPKSIFWDIDPEAIFTGAGVGFQKFPSMASNGGQQAVGPWIQSRSYQKAALAEGGIAAFQVEMVQPTDYGAGQSVAFYAGSISANPDVAGNNWAINCLTHAQLGAGGIFQSIEADANNDSSTAIVKGIAISGAGTHDADIGLEIARLQQKWKIGIYIANSADGLVTRTNQGGRGIVVNGPPSGMMPLLDVVAVADTAVSARQFINGGDTLFFQRNTDTAPTGQFIRAVNAANSANIFIVDVSGNMTLSGATVTTTLSLSGPAPVVGVGQVSFGAGTSTTANAGAAGAPPGQVVGYLIVNIAGTNRKIPYYAT